VPAGEKRFVVGSQRIALPIVSVPVKLPTMRTRPSSRVVAVCSMRTPSRDPASPKVVVAGSHISAEARISGSWPLPATTSTRPSASSVAVW
jgi:hypothetical protein